MRHSRRVTKRTKRRTMKGGFYGASGAIAPGAMGWSASSEMGDYAISRRGGNSMIGAGRRRKGKKSRKVTHRRKHTSRGARHTGGSKYGAVAASFQGAGERGLINVTGVNTKGPIGSPAYGAWNDGGAHPGSGHSSFVRAH